MSLTIQVDNRQSQRRIKNINCYLRQTIKIPKNKKDESKGLFWRQSFDLHRIQINKGNFAEMVKKHNMNSSENSKQDTKRVHGKFLLEFDLQRILSNIKVLQAIQSDDERIKMIRQRTVNKAGMTAVDANTEKQQYNTPLQDEENKFGGNSNETLVPGV